MSDEELDFGESPEEKHTKWIRSSLSIARERRKIKYVEAKEKGCNWLLECRDIWDAHDADAGVFFVDYNARQEVDEKVKKSGGDIKVLGIYDLSLPLEGQGPGVAPVDWKNNL